MTVGGRLMVVLGFVLHLVVGFFYLVSALLVPGPGVALLLLLWIGMLAAQILRRRQPKVVLGIPFVAAAVWFAVVEGGSRLFGWTA
jgi:hypothetical protein